MKEYLMKINILLKTCCRNSELYLKSKESSEILQCVSWRKNKKVKSKMIGKLFHTLLYLNFKSFMICKKTFSFRDKNCFCLGLPSAGSLGAAAGSDCPDGLHLHHPHHRPGEAQLRHQVSVERVIRKCCKLRSISIINLNT